MSRDRQQFNTISERFFQENEILLDRVREVESLNAKLQDDNEFLRQDINILNTKVRNLENQVKEKNKEIAILNKQISKEPKKKAHILKKQQQRSEVKQITEKRVTRSQVG